MITIMKTKTFLNALDDAYAKGVSAGANAEMVKEKEDQNRRLHDMYSYGKRTGYVEAYDALNEDIEEINLSDLIDDVGEALE